MLSKETVVMDEEKVQNDLNLLKDLNPNFDETDLSDIYFSDDSSIYSKSDRYVVSFCYKEKLVN